jgi:hypothetical protein
MTKILIAIAIILCSLSAQSQITSTGGQVYLSEGAISSYTNPDIYVSPKYNPFVENWVVTCTVTPGGADIIEVVEFTVTFRKSEIDSYTGTGTGDTAKLIHAIEQAVIDYMEGISANSGITFSH